MAIRLPFGIKIPKLHLRRNSIDTLRTVHIAGAVIAALVSLWVLWLVGTTVVGALVLPRPIDASHINARQEKVNRKLLDAITQIDEVRKKEIDLSEVASPFTPPGP